MKTMRCFDTHCHLYMNPLCEDTERILHRAGAAGVIRMIVPCVDTESWDQVKALAEKPGIFPALGIHPWSADEELDSNILENELFVSSSVAVGEIGLDFKVETPDRNTQIRIFRKQLDVALELDLPVILHCRGAFDEILSILSEDSYRGTIRGVVHAFSRGRQLARRFLDLGFFLAFGGAVTRPRAVRARKSSVYTPSDRMLLETDAPSIGMDGLVPGEVEPSHLVKVAEAIALLRGTTVEDIAGITWINACKLFRIDPDD